VDAGDALMAAGPLSLLTQAASLEAAALVAEVVSRVSAWERETGADTRRGDGLKATLQRAVEALAGGLLLTAARHGEGAWCRQAIRPAAFTGQPIGYRPFVAAHRAFVGLSLARHHAHLNRFHDFGGGAAGVQRFSARLAATPALVALAQTHGLALPMMEWHWRQAPRVMPPRLLILRDVGWRLAGARVRGAELPQPKGAEADAIRANITAANRFLSTFTYDGCDPPALYRTFTRDLRHNGRWFGGIEDMPAEVRQDVRIGGEPVCEVDVRASHLSILHGLQRLPLPGGDPYAGLGFPREVVKAWVTACIGNGGPVARWSQEARERAAKPREGRAVVDVSKHAAKAVGGAVVGRYSFLARVAEVVGCGDEPRLTSLRLMALEAEALTRALDRLRERGMPALPVHDALVVRESDAEAARVEFAEAFEAVVRVRPVVR
jgi:hypothetical protein